MFADRRSVQEHVQATGENRRQERGLGEHLSTLYRMLCPHRVYSASKEEGACENRGGIGFFRVLFDLVKHIKLLRKIDFRENPHFEGFSENQ